MTLSRRDLIKLGAGAGAYLAAGGRPLLGQRLLQSSELVTRAIPSSGERIPVVGIGMRNYRVELPGGDLTPYRDTLKVFHDGGGKLLDTAPSYGNSESVLGVLLEDLGFRDDLFIATKVDRPEPAAAQERMEASFEKVGTDHFELMQVHNLRGAGSNLEILRAWRDEGRFRYIGVTTSSRRQYERMEEVMRANDMDFIQVDYSLGNRSAAETILPLALDRGMAVLVNLPFGRTRLFQAVGDRELPDWAGDIECDTWAKVFLKYVVSHPAVTAAIPGTTKPHHAEDNIGAARGPMPDEALRAEMERYFDAL